MRRHSRWVGCDWGAARVVSPGFRWRMVKITSLDLIQCADFGSSGGGSALERVGGL